MADPHSPVRSSASSDVRPEEAGGEPEAAPCPAVSVFLPRPPVGVMAVAQGFGDRLALTQGTAAAHRRCEASGYLTPTSPRLPQSSPTLTLPLGGGVTPRSCVHAELEVPHRLSLGGDLAHVPPPRGLVTPGVRFLPSHYAGGFGV